VTVRDDAAMTRLPLTGGCSCELDAGRQVVVGQRHHFVRLQSVTDEFVTKDDPGHHTGANEKATWEEARAMGLFLKWIVIE
jgi:hypothetical protein